MPRTGFIPRCDIPVLNEREGISRIAVPVVSEPVPAVVGMAINGRSSRSTGLPLPMGTLMKSIKSASWYTVNLKFNQNQLRLTPGVYRHQRTDWQL